MIRSAEDAYSDANRLTLLMRQTNTRLFILGMEVAHGGELELELRCECGDPRCSAVVTRTTSAGAFRSPPGSILAHPARR